MTFLQPLLLLALLTLPVILLLHMLRHRRRRLVVPSLLHWLNVPRRREGERALRLPLTLLLLLHLLVAGLLGLALGRPQLLGAFGERPRQLAIILDSSTSMAAREGRQSRFAQAQERAGALLRRMGPADRVTLITAGPVAQLIAQSGGEDRAALSAALAALQPGGTGTDLAGALQLAEAAMLPDMSGRIVVLSDGALPPQQARTLSVPLDWQQVGSALSNRALIAFAAEPWGDKLQVYARAANYGDAGIDTSLRLYGDEQLLDTREVELLAGGEAELTWTLPHSYATLRAELAGRDTLPEDDQGYLNVNRTRPIRTLLVSAEPDPLRRALEAVPGVSLSVVEPARYASAASRQADLTIFNAFLPQDWPAGATLVINPPDDSALLPVQGAARQEQQAVLQQRGALLEGLSLGGVQFSSIQRLSPPDWAETLLALGETPLILRGRYEDREIAIWTFELAGSSLPSRLAFPLLVARTVRDLAPAPLPTAVQAGAPLRLRPAPHSSEVRISGPGGQAQVVPTTPQLSIEPLRQPGFYSVEERSGTQLLFKGQLGVNAGSDSESDLRPRPAALRGAAAAPAGSPGPREVSDLWPWLTLAALLILMLEWGYSHR